MKKEILLPFSDLKEEGVIRKVDKRFKSGNNVHLQGITKTMHKVSLDFEPAEYFMKNVGLTQAFAAMASSNMYKNIGINTPPVFMLKDFNEHSANTLQQSVYNLNDALVSLANADLEYLKIGRKFFGKFKWQVFYDSALTQEFLKFMTPECLEELQNIFLIDEMRTDIDRHTKNYFFYKRPNSDKYEGIIVIDLELMTIFNYCGSSKDDFDSFVLYPYQSETPQQVLDELCYLQRVTDIREAIQDGVLSAGNINMLKKALSHDFPKEMKNAMKGKILHPKTKSNIITPVSRLWEYNQKTIGKDLGL